MVNITITLVLWLEENGVMINVLTYFGLPWEVQE